MFGRMGWNRIVSFWSPFGVTDLAWSISQTCEKARSCARRVSSTLQFCLSVLRALYRACHSFGRSLRSLLLVGTRPRLTTMASTSGGDGVFTVKNNAQSQNIRCGSTRVWYATLLPQLAALPTRRSSVLAAFTRE